MSTIDIRCHKIPKPINEIIFGDRGLNEIVGEGGTAIAAHILKRPNANENFLQIRDQSNEFVNVVSAEHARNLIKALEKSIELGWLK